MSVTVPHVYPLPITEGTYRVTGCPGSGKTTFLAKQVLTAADTHGPGSIAIVSFTNAAAAEIADPKHGLPLAKHQIGTLHSFAYHAIGLPPLLETGKHLKQWNEHIEKKDNRFTLGSNEKDPDDLEPMQKHETEGDRIFAKVNILRNKLIPRQLWAFDERSFMREWEAWKTEMNGIDFTDMLEIALRDVDRIPWNPSIGLHDEANDSSRLMLALWGKWARHMDYDIIAGDADQVLYSWAGVDPGAFLDLPIADTHKRYRLRSYRCPKLVTDYANSVIQQCQKRDPISMLPRLDESGDIVEGELRRISARIDYPEAALRDAEIYLSQGKSVAFLTTCSYMLRNLIAVLRKGAYPFHNKFRRKRGDWNPLFAGRGTSTSTRILSFLNTGGDLWSVKQLRDWIEIVEADGILARGAKKEIANFEGELISMDDCKRWFAPCWPIPACQDLDWLETHILNSKQKVAKYPLSVMRTHGIEALKKEPMITVGTIHSVKGATFDVVYLFPDLSMPGMEAWWSDRDSVLRTWYVGSSRSRESLILCSPSSPLAIRGI
jgi:DNA helicase II / ATP-dependent DNA helicase PcrA